VRVRPSDNPVVVRALNIKESQVIALVEVPADGVHIVLYLKDLSYDSLVENDLISSYTVTK
jgi:hypothetical protein